MWLLITDSKENPIGFKLSTRHPLHAKTYLDDWEYPLSYHCPLTSLGMV